MENTSEIQVEKVGWPRVPPNPSTDPGFSWLKEKNGGQASHPHPQPRPITAPRRAGGGGRRPQRGKAGRGEEDGRGEACRAQATRRVWSPLVTEDPGATRGRGWPVGCGRSKKTGLHTPHPQPLQPPLPGPPPTTSHHPSHPSLPPGVAKLSPIKVLHLTPAWKTLLTPLPNPWGVPHCLVC